MPRPGTPEPPRHWGTGLDRYLLFGRGGVLLPTPLTTFATQGEVRDYLKNNDFNVTTEGNKVLRGHEVVLAAEGRKGLDL